MVALIALVVLSAATAAPTSVAAARQEVICPAETPKARSTLVRYLTGAGHAEERQRYGIPEIAPDGIRVLTDADDSDVCALFQQGIGQSVYGRDPYRLTYYAADGYYFITITNEGPMPGSSLIVRHYPSVIVLTRDLRPVNVTAASR